MWICSCVSHHPALLHLQLDHGWMFFWYKAALKSSSSWSKQIHLPKTLWIIYRCFLANDRQAFMFFLIVASQSWPKRSPRFSGRSVRIFCDGLDDFRLCLWRNLGRPVAPGEFHQRSKSSSFRRLSLLVCSDPVFWKCLRNLFLTDRLNMSMSFLFSHKNSPLFGWFVLVKSLRGSMAQSHTTDFNQSNSYFLNSH